MNISVVVTIDRCFYGKILARGLSMRASDFAVFFGARANAFDLVSPWSQLITVGASVGIFTFFLVFFVFTPTAKGLSQLVQQMRQIPQQPPPEKFRELQKRIAILGPLAVTLLLLAEVFMVAAAQF